MLPSFHLSLPVRALEEEVAFFERVGGTVTHRDPRGYVNLDLFGTQLTLAEGTVPPVGDLHFGVNLEFSAFEQIAATLGAEPVVADAGTAMERRKLYALSPSGYRVELKGYAR